jgi:hypothetical protein
MHKAEEVLGMVLVAYEQSPEILQPGKQALDLPPTTVTPQGAPVLRGRLLSVGPVGRDQLDPYGGQLRV